MIFELTKRNTLFKVETGIFEEQVICHSFISEKQLMCYDLEHTNFATMIWGLRDEYFLIFRLNFVKIHTYYLAV